MGKDVIVACDFASAEQTFAFLDKFTGKKPFVKIGMELYYAEGPAIVKEIEGKLGFGFDFHAKGTKIHQTAPSLYRRVYR